VEGVLGMVREAGIGGAVAVGHCAVTERGRPADAGDRGPTETCAGLGERRTLMVAKGGPSAGCPVLEHNSYQVASAVEPRGAARTATSHGLVTALRQWRPNPSRESAG